MSPRPSALRSESWIDELRARYRARDLGGERRTRPADVAGLIESELPDKTGLRSPPFVCTVESGGNLRHEASHLVFDLAVGFQSNIEIEDHLVEPGGLDLLQGIGNARG